jgi:hypothetical protein
VRLMHAGAVGLLVLVLAACGGGGGGATADPADAGSEPTEAAAPTVAEPVDSPAAGGGGGGSGEAWATKPCDLLAQADVENAAGGTGMTPTPVTMDATSGLCGYRAADDNAEVVVTVWGGDAATAMSTTIGYLADQNTEGIERIGDLGADAVFSATDGTIFVWKNDSAVQVAVRLPDRDPAAIKAIALDLGRQVAGKL